MLVSQWQSTQHRALEWRIQLISSYREHHGRVCSLSWSRESLASGSADTQIILKDFRCRGTGYRKLEGHPTEVCGLRWCPDGILLASGSLSEEVLVWDRRSRAPYSKLGGHKAAVKALAWNPRSTGILATGTGLSDKLMRVWDVERSQQLHAIDTGSQITGLEWSPSGTEIVSSHGFQANELVVWRYPSLNQIVKLSAHANRLAYMVRSSDGTCVVTGSGHEKICFWKLFPPYVPPTSHPSKSPSPSMLFPRHTIR
ncbi:Fizzy- protein [Entomophthora muscae]|uniref:Fizzy- protein n=1 Tax=Entomophthora muscae TaxID=34485 RepID=A0ACC2TTZ9_9FUNG|nr:Fizzy- protein [Entomophthora muscae]